jgi:hypothetical protein
MVIDNTGELYYHEEFMQYGDEAFFGEGSLHFQ